MNRTVVGMEGYSVIQEDYLCRGGCGRLVTFQWASHGGDVMDVDDPLLGYCPNCRAARSEPVEWVPLPEAFEDDLPFD